MPTKVPVAVAERSVTDSEFEQAIRKAGGGRISATHLRDLETIGLRVKGAGTLMGLRGESWVVRSVLWNSLQLLEGLLDKTMARPDKDKRKIMDAIKVTDGMCNLAQQITKAEELMLDMEKSTSDGPTLPGQISELPLPPKVRGMEPGQTVKPATLVVGNEIHLHQPK